MATKTCKTCDIQFHVPICRVARSKYCSQKCRIADKDAFKRGSNHYRWKGGIHNKVCKTCGSQYETRNDKSVYCSMECAGKAASLRRGKLTNNWKGGRRIDTTGYVLVRVNGGSKCGGYALEHRHKMERKLGRKLSTNEIVHHKNGIKTDNRLCNLEVLSRAEHGRLHRSTVLRGI